MIRKELDLLLVSCAIATAAIGFGQTANAADDLVVKNPQPQEMLLKNVYFSDTYVKDHSGSLSIAASAAFDTYEASKKGFLLNLYSFIGVLPPVYQEGYKPGEVDQKIAQLPPNSDEWSRLRKLRAEKNMQARLQALINAGYLKPEEINDAQASKQFVAEVLYRMFQGVRPYKGSVAPLDSQSIAVRWAVETGFPGFGQNAEGFIKPEEGLQPDSVNANPYRELFDFLRLYLPSKKTEKGWEYYQFAKNPAGKLNAEEAEKFSQLISQKRSDVMKPRIEDSRQVIKNVLDNIK